MKEIPSLEHPSDTQNNSHRCQESPQTRKQRIDRNRALRKQKVIFKKQLQEAAKLEKCSMTREERAERQKVKNREAAQKSREQKKHYLQYLEDQILELKEKLEQSRYCEKCRGLISKSTSVSLESEESKEAELSNSVPYRLQLNRSEEVLEEPIRMDYEMQQSNNVEYMRVGSQRNASPFAYLTFIFMIAIAVLCFGGAMTGSGESGQYVRVPRELMYANAPPLYSGDLALARGAFSPQSKIVFDGHYDANAGNYPASLHQNQNQAQNGLVPLKDVFMPFSQKKCFKDIVNTTFESSSAIEQITNLRAEINAKLNPNLLFCHFPRIYKADPSKGIFNNELGIVISGKDLKEVSYINDEFVLSDIIDMDGIYELRTQIKQIIKLDQITTCLV